MSNFTSLKLLFPDGERGPPNIAVDQQRNRVVTAAALKDADSLASQGQLSVCACAHDPLSVQVCMCHDGVYMWLMHIYTYG